MFLKFTSGCSARSLTLMNIAAELRLVEKCAARAQGKAFVKLCIVYSPFLPSPPFPLPFLPSAFSPFSSPPSLTLFPFTAHICCGRVVLPSSPPSPSLQLDGLGSTEASQVGPDACSHPQFLNSRAKILATGLISARSS